MTNDFNIEDIINDPFNTIKDIVAFNGTDLSKDVWNVVAQLQESTEFNQLSKTERVNSMLALGAMHHVWLECKQLIAGGIIK